LVARIKGTAVRARLDYLAARFGETGLQRVLDQLSAELHAEIADGVLISAWYPLELSEAILGAAERLLGKGDGSLCEEIGLASARKGLTSTYAAFAVQPEASGIADKMRRTTSLVWRSYYDVGEFNTFATGPTTLRSELTGMKLQSPWLCHVLIGYIAGHVEVLGGHNVRVAHVSCVLRGRSRCRWEASWQTAPA
jgi:predicted hydrocarbon binding protein